MPPRKTKLAATAKTAKSQAKAPAPEVRAGAAPKPGPGGPPPRADAEPAAPAPSRVFAGLALSEPWMTAWTDGVLATGSVEEACAAVHVSLADFADARGRDPVFDDLCRRLDRIADLRIAEKLRVDAMRGDIRAQTLYYARVRDLILPEAAKPSSETMIDATVAEAMLSAGLLAAST